jgi:hypothetical protein
LIFVSARRIGYENTRSRAKQNGYVPFQRAPQTLGERLFLVRNEHGLTWGPVAHLLDVETLAVAAYAQGHPIPQRALTAFTDIFAAPWGLAALRALRQILLSPLGHVPDADHQGGAGALLDIEAVHGFINAPVYPKEGSLGSEKVLAILHRADRKNLTGYFLVARQ